MTRTELERLAVGEWTAIPEANELRHANGRRERLEARAMDVLALLYRRAGSVVPVDEILDQVWEGRTVSHHSVAIVVSDLRKALGDDARSPRYIETVPKRGYRLIAASAPSSRPRRVRRWPIWLVAIAALMVLTAVGERFAFGPVEETEETDARAGADTPAAAELERLFLARQLWSRRDQDGVLEAVAILSRVVEENPRSAAGHAALAAIYAHKSGQHLGMPALDTFREAQRHLDRARAIDARRADVQVAQGLLDFFRDHQPLKAWAALDRALDADPGSSLAWQARAMVASALGRHDESLDAIERAAALDPVSASVAWDRVWFLYLADRPEASRAAIDRALDAGGRSLLYEALVADRLGDDRRALELWLERLADRGFELPEGWRVLDLSETSPAMAYAELVRQTAALPADHDAPGVRALWRLEAGDPDAATAILVEAPPSRDHWMILWLHEIPAFEPLRRRPEIEALIARAGVAPARG